MDTSAFDRIAKRSTKGSKKYVSKSLDIVEEILALLERKKIKPADLARSLGKQESEISRWLTGMHNLTVKTITKIETELNEDIIVTKSKMAKRYRGQINDYKASVDRLAERIRELEGSQKIVINAEIKSSNGANTIISVRPELAKSEQETKELIDPVFAPSNASVSNPFIEIELR